MPIRSAAKALIIDDGNVLLNKCMWSDGTVYYDLPGGGQHQYESLEATVTREVLEETGYSVKPIRFAALTEEIYDSPDIRMQNSEYSHRVHHIFIAALNDRSRREVTELDAHQETSIWFTLDEADCLNVVPATLKGRISELVRSETAFYLGAHHML